VDEVWPNLYIGDAATANNRFELWKLGITHVLNAAHGGLYCQGSPDFYGSSVSYLGVPAHDLPSFDISAYFSSAADFIHRALSTPGAKVLVHCVVGVSRSATLVLAYLMLRQQLSLRQAVITVRQHRWVFPNRGFLHQLCQLDQQLRGTDRKQVPNLVNSGSPGAKKPLPREAAVRLREKAQRLLWVRRAAMLSHINEVWPNLFLGDAYAARDKSKLVQLGITHVVNVAAGKFQVDTGAKFYRGMPLEYYGIEADDNPFFDLSVYFLPVAQYIRTALSVPQGRVLVHCAMGVSRSATVVLAFLMICENMTLVEAIRTVQAHRDICPNSGFLRQLQVLDNRLGRET
uniref:Dual specificity phosphatase 13 n=1 Tax=Mustela putorius furo TaxID=9669 RepID=M3XW07_MUSPF